jgi:hypothetical protein
MGVLNDYFRARDDHEAARVTSHLGGPLRPGDDGHPAFDGVDAKGMDHTVVLGQLIALLRGVPWTPTLCGSRLVEDACGDLEEGPWVVVIDDDVRDDLAAISPAALPALAERWTGIEELEGTDPSEIQPVLEALCALARRAREAGEHLYEWCSL